MDLTSQWFMSEDSEILTLMLDSHRPIHHNNVNAGQKLIIIEDPETLKDCPTAEDITAVEGAEAEDEEEGEAYFDEDQSNAEDNKENRQQDVSKSLHDEEEDDDIEVQLGKKRQLKLVNQKKLRQLERKQKRNIGLRLVHKIEKYYTGSYFGDSIAGIAFSLSRQLNQDSDKFLWLWILGLTEMLINKKIDSKTYQKSYKNCSGEKDRYKIRVSALDESRPC